MEDIKKAIEVLKYHQEWRKGAEDIKKIKHYCDLILKLEYEEELK